jgi:GT2 family glycosyltransferase
MIGIVIPTYDSLDTLKALVKSIEKYTKDYELVIIEDGINRKTRRWLMHQNCISVFHDTNKGISASFNDGIRLTRHCDNVAFFNDDIEIQGEWWPECELAFSKGFAVIGLTAPSPVPITGWFFVLSRRCLDKIGLFDEDFPKFMGEDQDLYYKTQSLGLKLIKLNLPVFHHGSKTINKMSEKVIKENRNTAWQLLRKKYPMIKMQSLD